MKRFDQRHRINGTAGSDFSEFVGELLRTKRTWGKPIACGSGGSDGCIDLFCAETATVIECKFVGQGATDRIEKEWADVRKKLDNNLKTVGGKAEPTLAPFAPWADSSRPIRKYVFVTSGLFANLAAKVRLVKSIQDFFSALARRGGYSHLEKIEVHALDWADLEAQLADETLLVFRWLKKWPSGFREISTSATTGFKSYLSGDTLPYLSRDIWASNANVSLNATESTIVDTLAVGAKNFIVITGQGGVGKTRLGLEVVRRLQDTGWIALACDGHRVSLSGIREVLVEATSSKKIVLFADYVEGWPALESFVNEINDLMPMTGHAVAFLGTCRSSYKERLPSIAEQFEIGGGDVEDVYSKAVAQHILRSTGAPDFDALAVKCRYNLAISSFLLYLNKEHPHQFLEEIDALRSEQNFESWVVRRIQVAGGAGEINVKAASAIMAACALPVEKYGGLASKYSRDVSSTLNVLVADRWIERALSIDGFEVWSVFHDIFADVLIARSFSQCADKNLWVEELLGNAFVAGALPQTITSIARLAGSDSLRGIDWCRVLRGLGNRHFTFFEVCCVELMTAALLAPAEKLSLIVEHQSFRQAVSEKPSCDGPLVMVAAALGNSPSIDFDQHILPLLDAAATRSSGSNIVIRRAFRVRPERYRAYVRYLINSRPKNINTNHLLSAWQLQATKLMTDEPDRAVSLLEEIQPSVQSWLSANGTDPRAYFNITRALYSAELIGGTLGRELGLAAFDNAIAWLTSSNNDQRFEAYEPMRAALTVMSKFELLSGPRLFKLMAHFWNWLSIDLNVQNVRAYVAFSSFLHMVKGAEPAVQEEIVVRLRSPVLDWLSRAENWKMTGAGAVYSHWIDAAAMVGGQDLPERLLPVLDFSEKWLHSNLKSDTQMAGHILISWLLAATALQGTQRACLASRAIPHLHNWFSDPSNINSKSAGLLFRHWLQCAPDETVGELDDYVRQWLAATGDYEGMTFVCPTWVERRRPFSVISSTVYSFFLKGSRGYDATWLIKTFYKQEDLPHAVLVAALAWMVRHPSDIDSLPRLMHILMPQKISMQMEMAVVAWVLMEQPVETIIENSYALLAARRLVANLLEYGASSAVADALGKIYLCRWIRDGRVFRRASSFSWYRQALPIYDQSHYFVAAVRELIDSGELCPATDERDNVGVRCFNEWAEEWFNPPA